MNLGSSHTTFKILCNKLIIIISPINKHVFYNIYYKHFNCMLTWKWVQVHAFHTMFFTWKLEFFLNLGLLYNFYMFLVYTYNVHTLQSNRIYMYINEYLELKDGGVNGFCSVTFEALDDCVENPLPDGHLLWVIISCPLKQIITLYH